MRFQFSAKSQEPLNIAEQSTVFTVYIHFIVFHSDVAIVYCQSLFFLSQLFILNVMAKLQININLNMLLFPRQKFKTKNVFNYQYGYFEIRK